MEFFKIKDWDEKQHYRDRAPPWIKLYNHLLDDYEFGSLQDASKLHLMLIWLLASRNHNKLPFNAKWIKQRIGVETEVDLTELLDFGFIELDHSESRTLQTEEHDASKVLQTVVQVADTEREREGEREERESRGEESINKRCASDVDQVFSHWMTVMGKAANTRLTDGRKSKIKQRLKNYSVDDIKKAIDGCAKSEHHMGGNDQGTVYDDLSLICRSDDKLEYFRDSIAKVDPRQIKQQSQDNTAEFVAMAMANQSSDPFSMAPDNDFLAIGGSHE